MSDLLEDGVYVRLPDAQYFGQPRLGSTDLCVLATRPADFWYGSRWNPDRPAPKQTDEMAFGSALHILLLEGEEAYAERVAVKPTHYPDSKTGEMKPWHGAATFCRQWEELNSAFTIITADADRRVRHMAALILHHPELGPVLRAGIPEVAILYTDESGVQMRAKLDYLLPRYSADLKSFGGDAKGLSVTQQVLSLVAQRNMDVQRFQYDMARRRLPEFLGQNRLFGATEEETDWLKRVAEVEDWSWCWIFFRRRDDERGYAPVVKPIIRPPMDATFESGRRKVELALRNYHTLMARFGPDVPWAIVESAEEPADHAFPAWISSIPEPISFTDSAAEAA